MDFRPSVRPQDARSRGKTTWRGRRCPITRQRATCGSWAALTTRSRTSPKPPFQNPSIAGSACVSAVWDSGGRWRPERCAPAGGRPRLRPAPGIGARHGRCVPRPPTFPRQIQGHPHARMGARPPTRPPAGHARPRPTVRRPHPPVSSRSAPLRRPDLPVLERQFDEQRFQFVLVARDRQLRLDPPQLRDPRLDLGLLLVQRPERG